MTDSEENILNRVSGKIDVLIEQAEAQRKLNAKHRREDKKALGSIEQRLVALEAWRAGVAQ